MEPTNATGIEPELMSPMCLKRLRAYTNIMY